MAKELLIFSGELESLLIEQVDLLDDHSVLRASVKKASALKKELRSRLLETQRARQRTRQELKRVRSSFEREERARRRLEETHKFLTDLEALRDEVTSSDNGLDINTQDKDLDPRDTKVKQNEVKCASMVFLLIKEKLLTSVFLRLHLLDWTPKFAGNSGSSVWRRHWIDEE